MENQERVYETHIHLVCGHVYSKDRPASELAKLATRKWSWCHTCGGARPVQTIVTLAIQPANPEPVEGKQPYTMAGFNRDFF